MRKIRKTSMYSGDGSGGTIREVLHCGSSNYFAENGISNEKADIIDKGNFEISEYFEIEKITALHLNQNSKILTLGGDHSITFPIIKAHHQKYASLDILQIDAHPIDFLKNLTSLLNLFQKSLSKMLGKDYYTQNSLKMIVYLKVEL
jgi:hypothetical protein